MRGLANAVVGVGLGMFVAASGGAQDMRHAGDAVRGKALFESKGACLDCHRVRTSGSRFGPDLTDIGARAGNSAFLLGRAGRGGADGRGAAPGTGGAPDLGAARRAQDELERSLVDPAADILPQNRAVRLVTRGGQSITARLLNQDTFSLQLIDTKEQIISIPKSELREFAWIKDSPMPSYRDTFSSQERADVIAYLLSLKGITK